LISPVQHLKRKESVDISSTQEIFLVIDLRVISQNESIFIPVCSFVVAIIIDPINPVSVCCI
jgi:hypothetical protein